MISIDDHPPSDPSSSHHHHHHHHHHHQLQQQKFSHDLKDSDIDLKSPDADLDLDLDDTNNLTSNFSIRDYVFSLRNKDIACNWPFSHRSLQLCLKHGVKNLLPPFQSLDLLRDNSCLSKCSLENHLPDEEFVSCFDGKSTENQLKCNGERALGSVSSNSSGSKRNNKSQFHFPEVYLAHTRSKEKPLAASQKTENIKKSKLVMKLNSGAEPVGEVAPNSFIISETMASKICPVCKIFTSSSNTTLNAHIDQCLTGEGTMKWTDNPKLIVKHRIKPRKTRLMVDIYETAPHCTVEELDRRNGTSWATNSSFPAQEFDEFQGEEDKEEPRMNTINPVIADNEGDVYIDTNGTKVRILSVPKAGSSDDHRARKLLKGVKGSKIVMGKKKNNTFKQKHQQKYLKPSPNARKICSPKPQARNGQEDVVIAEDCSKDERGIDPVNAQVQKKVADLVIVRPPWACSKRTDLAKKLSGKQQKLELESRATKDLFIKSDKSKSQCNLESPRRLFNNVSSSKSQKKLRTQQALTSNIMSDFSKERSICDDYKGSPVSSPSQHSDDADFRLKGDKFSYLRRNLSFSEAKITLKRKFSSVKKSQVLCLLNEKYVDEPSSQDSLEEQSRMEEHAGSRRKEETVKSITSKSSNKESVDALPDIESIRNETLSNTEQVCVVPESFVCLSNSFDPEFSKEECIGLYQDPLLGSSNHSPDDGNDVEKHENNFQEVDPIPIPGPPGSFLPSPGGETVSEEQLQANSSLTTTRVVSSENHHHHDVIDQDSMSTSPVSDVSNPSLARSGSRSPEKLAYKSTSVDATYKKSLPNGDTSFKNDQPCCCSRKEGTSGGFRNFDRGLLTKESSFSYTVASNYQDSSVLRKQTVETNGVNFRPEMFSLSNYPTSPAPEKPVIIPTALKVQSAYSYCDSAASPSKPVLRLMGKNLTVVKTDEDASSSSQQFRPLQSSQQHPQQPLVFNQYQNGSQSQNFNGYPQINMMRNLVDLRPPSNGGFTPMVERNGPYLGTRMPEARSQHGYNGASGSKPVKEIVVIDDSSENEGDDSMRMEFMGRNSGQMNNPLYTMYRHPYGVGGGFQTWLANGDLGMWKLGSSSPLPSTSTHLRSLTPYNPPSYP